MTIQLREGFEVPNAAAWPAQWTPSSAFTDWQPSVAGRLGAVAMSVAATNKQMLASGLRSGTDKEFSGRFSMPRGIGSTGNETLIKFRFIDVSNDYHLHFYLTSAGVFDSQIIKQVAAASSPVTSRASTGLSPAVGQFVGFRTQALGASPTTLRARWWLADGPEPTAWNIDTTDATVGLQVAASAVRLTHWVEIGATGFPYTWQWGDLRVTDAAATTAVATLLPGGL